MHTSPTLIASTSQLWIIFIGSIVPLFGYVLNKVLPNKDEAVKAAVQVVLAAAVGAAYTAINTHVFGWNPATAQLILTAVVASLAAHHMLWKPSGISMKLSS